MACLKRLRNTIITVVLLMLWFFPALDDIGSQNSKYLHKQHQNFLQQPSHTIAQELFREDSGFIVIFDSMFDLSCEPSNGYINSEWDIFNTTPGILNSDYASILTYTAPENLSLISPLMVDLIRNESGIFDFPNDEIIGIEKKKIFETGENARNSSFFSVTLLLFICVLIGLISVYRHLKKFN